MDAIKERGVETAQINERIELLKMRGGINPAQVLLSRFNDWLTPNTYTERYDTPKNKPGIYCFIGYRPCGILDSGVILYIGSSKALYNRCYGHNRTKEIYSSPNYDYVHLHFRYCDNYLKIEKELIKEFRPLLNVRVNG